MIPLDYVKQDILQCAWDPATYLIFSKEVEPLVYYSHLFPAIAVLFLAIFVISNNLTRLTSKLFFIIGILFSIFAVFDLILWATEKPSLIMFLWSSLTYIEPLIYATTLYMVSVFAKGQDLSLQEKSIGGLLLLPVILLGPTHLNLSGFDYTNCWRLAEEGPLLIYVYIVEIIFVIWIVVISLIEIRKNPEIKKRKAIILLTTGSLLFLLAFSSGNIFGTLLQGVMGEGAWVIGQYGFFGMPLFLGFILYLIVEFRTFNIGMIASKALLITLIILVGSQFTINISNTGTVLTFLTLVFTGAIGLLLLRGVKKEIKQKEELQVLTEKLALANEKLQELDKLKSEFVSIASHQLRSPLTAIRGYASLLTDGSYGKLPAKAMAALERISESSKNMAYSIEDYLNVSRIESGNMKYNLSDFSLKDETEKMTDDLRSQAIKKGLMLLFRSDLKSKGIIHADIGKVVQIIQNLINNSIKYTPEGSIKVLVRDDIVRKKIYIDIIDTGIGLNSKALNSIFGKFERADNANTANIHGTGLGLFVAHKMTVAMGGDITATSEGDGKGSTFTIQFPLAM